MRPVSTWKVEEVGEWFDRNNAGLSAEGLARYKELFAEKGIDGFMLSSVPTTLPLTLLAGNKFVLCIRTDTSVGLAGGCRRRTWRTW